MIGVATEYGMVYVDMEKGSISDTLDRDRIWQDACEDYGLQQCIYDAILCSVLEWLGDFSTPVRCTDFGATATSELLGVMITIDSEGAWMEEL